MSDKYSALKYSLSKLVLPAVFLGLLVAMSEIAQTQTETVLYSFCAMPSCADGATPDSGLILRVNSVRLVGFILDPCLIRNKVNFPGLATILRE
jgi:hypothetical protein